MKRSLSVVLLSLCLVTAGCAGLLNHESGESPELPDEGTTTLTSNGETQTISGSPDTESQALSDREREYVNSGQGFGILVEDQLEHHDQTRFVSSRSYPNNTIDITIQLQNEQPLYWSMMDGVQAVAAVTFHSTTDSDRLPKENGSFQRLHEPERVDVYINGPGGDLMGSYTVDPKMARQYRLNQVKESKFTAEIVDSYIQVRDYQRGEIPPSHYLNRSELAIWTQDYIEEVQNSTSGTFDQPFPVDNIRTNASSHEILHEFEWSQNEFGQAYLSASAAAYGSYWRTTDKSWAMAPERLNIFIHRVDNNDNYASYMERENVYTLLNSNRDSANLTAYMDQENYQFIGKSKNPFEYDF